MQLLLRYTLSIVLLSSIAAFCHASCDECGCANAYSGGKVCKLVCEEKTISVVCYKCEEEPFCIPDPSCKQCKHCEEACEGSCTSGCCDGCTHGSSKTGRLFIWFNWKPTTARMATKKKLFTKTVKKKIPSYKWVVVDTCECGACATNFNGKDTGYTKNAPQGVKAGQVIAADEKEVQRLVKVATQTVLK